MTILEWVLMAIIVVENIAILGFALYRLKFRAPGGVKIKDGVRYTKTSETSTDTKPVNISYNEKDVVLVADKVYTVGKNAEVKPGKYIILSTQEGKEYLTMKINDYARNQKHGAEVVFAEGDIVIAVNEPIILR